MIYVASVDILRISLLQASEPNLMVLGEAVCEISRNKPCVPLSGMFSNHAVN